MSIVVKNFKMLFKDKLSATKYKDIKVDFKNPLPNKSVPFIWFFAKKLQAPLIVMSLFYILTTMIFALEPVFIGQLIEELSTGNKDNIWQNVSIIVSGYIFIVQIMGRLFSQLGRGIQSQSLPLLTLIVRKYLSVYLQKHSYNFFQNDFAGRISGKVIEMPNAVRTVIDATTNGLLYTLVNSIMSIILFSYIHWSLGVSVVVFIIVSSLLMRWRLPIVYKYSAIATASLQNTRGRFIDSVSNILLVKLFAKEKFEDKYFTNCLIDSGGKEQKQEWQNVLLWRYYHIVCAIFQSVIMLLCVYGYQNSFLDISDIATAFPLSIVIIMNLWGFMKMLTAYFNQFAVIQNSLDTIIQNHQVKDVKSAKNIKITNGEIVFNNVSFAYSNNTVFKNFSLTIGAKQKIGLIGSSGAGKSTFIQLLLRLFDVNNGEILIDNINIAKVKQQSLRENISVIPQNNDLLHRTVLENIKYGKQDATLDEVIAASKKAHIHDVIMNIEDGLGNTAYNATVGEKGVKLSGGQRQRIALARAFLKDAPILILDEATSALDSESEKLIQQSLLELMKNRTVIVIAHRLSTISHLDKIIVMDNGKIIEQGSHAKLIKNKQGVYNKLWSLQSEGFL